MAIESLIILAPGENCQLPDLLVGICSISAAVVDGVPIFCGGHFGTLSNMTDDCFKFNKGAKDWVNASDLKTLSISIILG
jgi:hypothetical protein